MARSAWIIGVFAAGVAVGFAVARLSTDQAPGAVAPPAAADTAPASAMTAPARLASAPRPEPPPPARSESPAATSVIPAPVAARKLDAEYSGYSQPIDAGPAFEKIMAQEPPPGTENRLGELHRSLEGELRDDSWAYPMEAELQNSLVAETSSGRLTVEHLECRATLCELRLSGSVANEQALTDWSSSVGKQPWATRLNMNLSSSISDGERVDSLLIFQRGR